MNHNFYYLVDQNLEEARSLHPGYMPTLHHGYGVLREEFDEFWDEVRKKYPDKERLRAELLQISAVAQRIYEDLL